MCNCRSQLIYNSLIPTVIVLAVSVWQYNFVLLFKSRFKKMSLHFFKFLIVVLAVTLYVHLPRCGSHTTENRLKIKYLWSSFHCFCSLRNDYWGVGGRRYGRGWVLYRINLSLMLFMFLIEKWTFLLKFTKAGNVKGQEHNPYGFISSHYLQSSVNH